MLEALNSVSAIFIFTSDAAWGVRPVTGLMEGFNLTILHLLYNHVHCAVVDEIIGGDGTILWLILIGWSNLTRTNTNAPIPFSEEMNLRLAKLLSLEELQAAANSMAKGNLNCGMYMKLKTCQIVFSPLPYKTNIPLSKP